MTESMRFALENMIHTRILPNASDMISKQKKNVQNDNTRNWKRLLFYKWQSISDRMFLPPLFLLIRSRSRHCHFGSCVLARARLILCCVSVCVCFFFVFLQQIAILIYW